MPDCRTVHLAAVQAEVRPADYRSAGSFRRRVAEMVARAVADAPRKCPRIVAFPEAFALPLVLWLEAPDSVMRARSLADAVLRWMSLRPAALLRTAFARRVAPPVAFYHMRALATWPLYESAFCAAAREFHCYIVAGSTFSPLVDHEPARGWHTPYRSAHNIGLVVGPHGRPLARPRKHRLTPGEKRACLRGGPEEVCVVDTAAGRVCVLICLDAFQESLVERADAAGARILVQPSANNARWRGPWKADPSRIEGEVWLEQGLARQLAGRESLRLGINPMLTGEVHGVLFEGRSSIAAPGRLLRLAERESGDEVLTWTGADPDGVRVAPP